LLLVVDQCKIVKSSQNNTGPGVGIWFALKAQGGVFAPLSDFDGGRISLLKSAQK